MYDIVCPGLTKERGLTLFELFSATFQLIKTQGASIMSKEENPDDASEHTPGNDFLDVILNIKWLIVKEFYSLSLRIC
jgi:hypothetical protein